MSPVNGDLLSTILVPILIFLGVAIVAVLGWLVWNMTRPKDDESSAAAKTSTTVSPTVHPYFLGVKRASRDRWEISVEGQPYATLNAIPDADRRSEVTSAIRALATFAGYGQLRAATQVAPTASSVVPPLRINATNDQGWGPRSEPPIYGAETPAQRGETAPIIDLAQEIGDIIDELKAQRPSLQNHAVSLQNSPAHGIAFVVDGIVYREISDIASPEVQALIRDATKEWERR